MHKGVTIGHQKNFDLTAAILVYGEFATLHDAVLLEGGAPQLGPAKPVSFEFLTKLSEQLSGKEKREFLGGNVLCRTKDTLVWWSQPSVRTMYWRHEGGALNALRFPQPALVWKVVGQGLFVRALKKPVRPQESTVMSVAPYWNTDGQDGRVCLGSMRVPKQLSVQSMGGWEEAYFASEFTHVTGGTALTTRPSKGGLIRMWTGLAGKKQFPTSRLAPTKQTLLSFIGGA